MTPGDTLFVEVVSFFRPSEYEMAYYTLVGPAALIEPTPFGEAGFAAGAVGLFIWTRANRLYKALIHHAQAPKALRAHVQQAKRTHEHRTPPPEMRRQVRAWQNHATLEEDGLQVLRRGLMPARLPVLNASAVLDYFARNKVFQLQAEISLPGGQLAKEFSARTYYLEHFGDLPSEIRKHIQTMIDGLLSSARVSAPAPVARAKTARLNLFRLDEDFTREFPSVASVHIDVNDVVISAGFTRTASGTAGGTLARSPSTYVGVDGPVSRQTARRYGSGGPTDRRPDVLPGSVVAPQPDRVVSIMNGNVPHRSLNADDLSGSQDRLFIGVVLEGTHR